MTGGTLIDGDIDRVKYYFLSIVLLAIGNCSVGCSNANTFLATNDKQLYLYKLDEVLQKARDYGFSENAHLKIISQNADGTKFFVGGSQSEQGPGRVFVFSLGEEEPTAKDLPPAYNIWLDEEGSAIAWWVIGESVVHLANSGKIAVSSGSRNGFQVDPSGRLAVVYDEPNSQIKLYQISSNGVKIVGMIEDAQGWLGRVFLGSDLNAYIECIVPLPDGSARRELYVLGLESGSYSTNRQIQLKGSVIAADVDSGWLYLKESHDFGFGKSMLFNFRTGESRSLGRFGRGNPFFLKGDILGLDQ